MSVSSLWHYRASLVRVIDGDTVVLLVDTGFGGRHEVAIRVAGIDAPELPSVDGIAATVALRRIVARGTGAWPVLVTTQRLRSGSEVMSFARYVGSLAIVEADGSVTDVAAAMVRDGHARMRSAS